MEVYLPSKEELEELISKAVKSAIKESLPDAIQKVTRNKWLTTDEVMEILNCSRRRMQYLRDTNQLAYTQNSKSIRYHIDDVEEFLQKGKVSSR